ncbi:putative sugar O-methyltransferase [Pseudomonadota bacterium]
MKYNYPELNQLIGKNQIQKKIYQATSFWKQASREIIAAIEKSGIENFRNLDAALGYFVPNYGIPANSFDEITEKRITALLKSKGTHKQSLAMSEFLSGYFHALADYRVFISSDNTAKRPILSDFSESGYGNPTEQFEFSGKKYSRSALNYLLGLCFLKKHMDDNDKLDTVLEIGGGFGTLGEILKFSAGTRYINIDIPPTSFISWTYLSNIYIDSVIESCVHDKKTIDISELGPCSVFNSWDIEKLEGEIDLFVNFISFQEMEPDVVENYLKHVKRLHPKYILLRNMREGKQAKKVSTDVGVETPIMKSDYIKMIEGSYSLIATNVFPFGYKTVDGFHSELLLFRRSHE